MHRKYYTNIKETRDNINDIFSKIKENSDFNEKINFKINELKEPNINNIGEQISYYRKIKGWTQIELAKKVNTCKECIRAYEHKTIKLVNVKLLKKIIKVLEIENKIVLPPYEKFILYEQSKNMKNILEKYDISVYRLAKKLNTDDSNVMKWVKGKSIMSRTSYNKLMNFVNKEKNILKE